MTITESFWKADQQLIVTRISGNATSDDVTRWEKSLIETLEKVPEGGVFKILVDLEVFKAVDFEVHKQFRVIVPKTLADYNWRVGYLDLFPEATLELKSTRGIRCVAAAHVHHDESKIKNYEQNHSRYNERFFTNRSLAREWIDGFDIPEAIYDPA